ncbi:hypothetical protein [Actinacidiphila acidipaludis]|uniref:Uncharacterized protein n=1 Tax=Actinacidiphila acidipaludis TaxID=2873382 RepID=A0ABS7QD08_9ACTN|nr:hypothetical protein [Streptomyces acidipaludis]MBY8881065.1 hypothetical protein [Streptomyces acidipaludis]
MRRATREPLPGDGLVLAVPGEALGPPGMRFESRRDGAWVLRQGERPLIRARVEGDGCCRDLRLHRFTGFRSPLPPVSAAAMRTGPDWPHRYALQLEDTENGPLHGGRWRLTARRHFAPGIWSADLVQDWPHATLELLCGGGWHGILPLRPLPSPDAPRVKALRKHAREGTLAPVLVWWISFLDGWVLLDGHDRAVAALAEGMQPQGVELARVPDDAVWQTTARIVTEAHAERMARLAARPPHPNTARQRRTLERHHADLIATLPYETAGTPVFDAPPSG